MNAHEEVELIETTKGELMGYLRRMRPGLDEQIHTQEALMVLLMAEILHKLDRMEDAK